ncbi:hypothetical protein [Senegalia massiliensis]|uniref:hypothetical protein n=1 Tax=Senegalia massiliensis TaxID=1720316 RepID=UPI0010300837|nr:hypothetical protein [Senegalia massiliensis]
MKQYEYKVEFIKMGLKDVFKSNNSPDDKWIHEKLNGFGKEGWELAGVSGQWFYFKRELS